MKNRKKYIFDIDSFFSLSTNDYKHSNKKHRLISIYNEIQSIDSLFEQYYLGLRSLLYVCEDAIDDTDDVLNVLKKYREGCAHTAVRYVANHTSSNSALPVAFLWATQAEIINELRNDYPEVEDIQLCLSMKPRISARTINKKTIVFPALARTVVNHCNLAAISTFFYIIDNYKHPSVDIDRREISRFILPYLLFCHDDFSVKNLPIISAYSYDAIELTFHYTSLQIMFILAHEYAHIILHHFEHNGTRSKSIEEIENEADSLALRVLIGYIKRNSSYSESDVFTSIRWLFKYQHIEESIGFLIQGKSLDVYNSKYEDRRGKFQSELFDNYNLKGSSLIDAIGFMTIAELEEVLYEGGPTLINNIISAFKKSDKTGGIEPWWEKIKQK